MPAEKNMVQVTTNERARIFRIFVFGLLLRSVIAVALHVSGLEQTLNLTKDATLYDRVGRKIAEYYRSGGDTKWPGRVSGFPDHLYEYVVGFSYYLSNDSVLVVRIVNVLCGSLVILLTWRTVRCFADADIALRCGIWACFFPTLVYYSCVPVRDAQSTLAMCLVFLGMTAIASSEKLPARMALPLGILLMCGYRTYVAVSLWVLLPISWGLTWLITRSSPFTRGRRNLLACALAATLVVPYLGGSLSSTRKIEKISNITSWNGIREQLNQGNGALFDSGSVPTIGESVGQTLLSMSTGLYFFFFSVNPAELSSVRQWMAFPESLIVLYAVPSLCRGLYRVARYHRLEFTSVVFVAAAITLAYSAATTNAGPLMRWRLQVVDVYIVLAAIGFSKTYSRGSEDCSCHIESAADAAGRLTGDF